MSETKVSKNEELAVLTWAVKKRRGHPQSLASRLKNAIAHTGLVKSPETSAKLSAALIGNKRALGSHRTEESLKRMSVAHMGNTNLLGYRHSGTDKAKQSAAQWKGGPSMSWTRHAANRRGLGFVFLNRPFLGCEGHHVDNEQVIYMPKELHRSVWHRQRDGRGMAKINAIAYNYLFKEEVEEALAEKRLEQKGVENVTTARIT
jgi:hypothetical protein